MKAQEYLDLIQGNAKEVKALQDSYDELPDSMPEVFKEAMLDTIEAKRAEPFKLVQDLIDGKAVIKSGGGATNTSAGSKIYMSADQKEEVKARFKATGSFKFYIAAGSEFIYANWVNQMGIEIKNGLLTDIHEGLYWYYAKDKQDKTLNNNTLLDPLLMMVWESEGWSFRKDANCKNWKVHPPTKRKSVSSEVASTTKDNVFALAK